MIFWDNLFRYPKFFISSMIGLILILLNPFIIQLKNFNGKIIFFIILIIALLYILKEMIALE